MTLARGTRVHIQPQKWFSLTGQKWDYDVSVDGFSWFSLFGLLIGVGNLFIAVHDATDSKDTP